MILLFSNWVPSPSTHDRTQWEILDVIILHVLYYHIFFCYYFPASPEVGCDNVNIVSEEALVLCIIIYYRIFFLNISINIERFLVTFNRLYYSNVYMPFVSVNALVPEEISRQFVHAIKASIVNVRQLSYTFPPIFKYLEPVRT